MKKTIGIEAEDYGRTKGNRWTRGARAVLARRFQKLVTLTPAEIDKHLNGKTPAQVRQELYELESGEPG
jgi:hypothetical protein